MARVRTEFAIRQQRASERLRSEALLTFLAVSAAFNGKEAYKQFTDVLESLE